MRILKTVAFACFAAAVLVPSNSWGFLSFFEKDYQNAPNNAQLQQQEAAAKVKLAEAQAEGSSGKAINIYKKIVQEYPLTTTAALSQYNVGTIYKEQGDFIKAFDNFQIFVESYKGSSAFASAVQSQFEITQAGQNGEFKEAFLGIPRKLQPSELLEMYGKVIANAPFSKYAPLAQFQIAEVYQNDGKAREAIAAYQKLVDDYPKSKKAPEAQYRIGAIGVNALERGSQDPAKVDKAKEAYNDLLIQFPDDERAKAARAGITKLTAGEAKKSYEIGSFYEKQKRYHSARIYFEKVAQVPESPYCEKAKEKLASLPETGVMSSSTLVEPGAPSERREFKFPSMPKVPKLFGNNDEPKEGEFDDSGSNLLDQDIDDVNWADVDNEMQGNLGNKTAQADDDFANAEDVDSGGGGFSMPKIAFWKKDDDETGGTVPEAAADESRSGLSRLAFWKSDKGETEDAPSASDFAPIVKDDDDSSRKKLLRVPRLPGFGKKDKEEELASAPVKKVKNQPNYVGPPAPKKAASTADVPARIGVVGAPIASSDSGSTSGGSGVTGGKPSDESKKRLVVPPPPED